MHPLRYQRLEKGWSQYHLSFLTGIAQVKISYAERGYPMLSIKQKEKIAKALNCKVTDIFPENERA